MADNVVLNSGSGGATVRAINKGGVDTQVLALDVGGTGGEVILSPANPLPALEQNLSNAQSSDSPIFTAITGDPSGDFAGVNLLETAMNTDSGLGFNVNVQNQPLRDANGALIISDAPGVQQLSGPPGGTFVLWMGGYKSLAVTVPTGITLTFFGSVDGVSYSTMTGILVSGTNGWVSGIGGTSNFLIPASTPWIKLIISAAGTISVCRRNVDIPAFLGVANSGLATAFAPVVGGPVATGIAPTNNPVLAAGWDGTLTRTVRTDTIGRVYVVGSDLPGVAATNSAPLGVSVLDPQNVTRRLNSVPDTATNTYDLSIIDQSSFEGSGKTEILGLILLELRMLNHQIYLLNTQGGASPSDDPGSMRSDPSLFQL